MARLHHRHFLNEARQKFQTHKTRRESIKNQRRLVMLACEGEKRQDIVFYSGAYDE